MPPLPSLEYGNSGLLFGITFIFHEMHLSVLRFFPHFPQEHQAWAYYSWRSVRSAPPPLADQPGVARRGLVHRALHPLFSFPSCVLARICLLAGGSAGPYRFHSQCGGARPDGTVSIPSGRASVGTAPRRVPSEWKSPLPAKSRIPSSCRTIPPRSPGNS